jgi:hypothetical protein
MLSAAAEQCIGSAKQFTEAFFYFFFNKTQQNKYAAKQANYRNNN